MRSPASEPLVRLVDDDASLCDAMEFMLRSEGWRVRTWTSAVDFLREDEPGTPGCVVLDWQMPDITGTEVQEILIRRGRTQPVLFLTAHADLDMAIHVFRKGAKDLLRKPVDTDEFLNAVAAAVERDLKARRLSDPEGRFAERFETLTPRERQVLLLVSRGLMNCQAASRLNLSERTIEAHRASGYRRLGIRTLGELTRFLEHVPEDMKKL